MSRFHTLTTISPAHGPSPASCLLPGSLATLHTFTVPHWYLHWGKEWAPKLYILPEPPNMTSFGSGIFADGVKLVRGHTGVGWDLNAT